MIDEARLAEPGKKRVFDALEEFRDIHTSKGKSAREPREALGRLCGEKGAKRDKGRPSWSAPRFSDQRM